MTHVVHVRAPCRLHFGMFSFGHTDRSQFGGIGVMIDPPAVELTFTPAAQFKVRGTLAERTKAFAEMAAASWRLPSLPACEICVRSPRDHIGLGVGTQLGLSVAAGLRRFLNLPELPAEALAADVGRGTRSAIGTHGFQRGGLIVDSGHRSRQPVGKLARRIAVPEEWRFVLVVPVGQRGLAGSCEADAFARLPPVPDDVTRRLQQITEHDLLPAVDRADCAAFGDAVYRFGRLAGECFSAVQGGPFANREIGQLIEAIRDYGVSGVGQSSWGPTVFAICSSPSEAEALVDSLRTQSPLQPFNLEIAVPCNRGARIDVQAD
jgi:beta-ribofuranosylaminobenzene 5'-phosphate synthase